MQLCGSGKPSSHMKTLRRRKIFSVFLGNWLYICSSMEKHGKCFLSVAISQQRNGLTEYLNKTAEIFCQCGAPNETQKMKLNFLHRKTDPKEETIDAKMLISNLDRFDSNHPTNLA